MTELAAKREDVKKKVRSLLLSAPIGLTLQELERDYYTFIGCRLPSRELGYTSTEEYLKSIPDAIQMTRKNGVVVLEGVANESTQNIQKLVSKQKVDFRKSWGVLRSKISPEISPMARGNFSQGRRREPTTYPQPFERSTNTAYNQSRREYVQPSRSQNSRDSTYQTARHRNMPSVPAYVRTQIHQLLLSYPGGFPMAHICNLFQKHYGVPLDHQSVGFSSILDFLASIADLVTLKQFSPGETWVMLTEPAKTTEMLKPCLNNRSDQASTEADVNVKCLTRTEMSLNLTEPSQDRTTPGTISQSIIKNVLDLCTTCNIPSSVQDHIQQIMANRPKGIWASRLPFEYKNNFKNDLPYKTYGYDSIIQFVSDLPHIIRIERPHPEGDWHFLPANVKQSAAEIPARQKGTENRTVDVKVDEQIKETISQILCMCADGVPLDNFEQVYNEMTGQVLDIKKYGASDLKHFLQSLPDIVCLALNSSRTIIVNLKASARPRNFDKLKDQYQPTTRLDNQAQEPVQCLPTDAVSPKCFYSSQPLPNFKNEPHFIQLFVSNVISPAVFWIQLKGRDTTLALEDLMDEMEVVYNSKHLPLIYSMTPSLAKWNMVCAAIFPEDGHWHRAIIMGVKDQLFEVYYVDYGNVCNVSITQMKLLKKKFLKLPAQAIRARLSNIQPVDGVWKLNSKNRLLELCREKPLVGLVTDFKDGVLSLCLTDTTNEFDIHVNDVLVMGGYANFVQDTDNVQIVEHSQAPSMELLYGKDAPNCSQENKSTMPSSRRYIRQAQMTDDIVMNMINLDGQLYLLSAEISNLFFEEDILSAQLYKDNTDVPKRVVTRKEMLDLFEELAIYGAPNFTDATKALSLFSLSALPLIIELYGKKGDLDEVKTTALEVLEWFDADDPYWKGEEDVVTEPKSPEIESPEVESPEVESSDRDSSDMPSLDDLQLVLQSLEIKKKRILNLIMKDSTCAPQYVNELNDAELNMKRVQALITNLQSAHDNSAQSSVCSLPVKTGPVQAVISPDFLPPVTSSHPKSTQNVAPTIQTSHMEQQPFCSSTLGLSSQPAVDMTALLQKRILLNSLMMEQLGIPQEVNNLPLSLMRSLPHQSFGRGINIQQQLSRPGLQTGSPNTMVTHSGLNPMLSLGSGAAVQPNAENLKGLGRGLSMDMCAFQHLPVIDLIDQSRLLQCSLLQTQSQGNPILQHQQSLKETMLLQQINNMNASVTTLGLNSLPMDSLCYSQFLGMQSPAQNALSGQGNHGGTMHNMNNLMNPSWFSASGAAPISLHNDFSSHTPSLVYGAGGPINVGDIPKGFATGALKQSQQFQQSLESLSDLASMMQLLNSGSGANVTPGNTQP